MTDQPAPPGPTVVALGGGHGLASALTAIRRYAGSITAVVSVADDGGSSGRLRRILDIPAPGDLRKCLVALAGDEAVWKKAFEHRFSGGELDGHALGNLLIVGLSEVTGDFQQALLEAGKLVDAVGRVLPATVDPVMLKAVVEGRSVEGQVAVANCEGRIQRVELVPSDATACADAVSAIESADQVVLAPGSLFTSLLPVIAVPGIRRAVVATSGRVIQVCNLRAQMPETVGLDGTAHLRAVLDHGGRVDSFLYHQGSSLAVDENRVRELGIEPVAAELADPGGLAHDPSRLATALQALL